jgi:hypothetical protein
LEDTRIDLDLLNAGAIKLFEGCDYASLFAGARRSIYEEMWEVTALCLWRSFVLE